MLHLMEKKRIEILDQIQMLDSGDVLDPDEAAALGRLKTRYNETVQRIYESTPGFFWDIIEVFPEDIWIQIIQHALPTYQYAAALLTLTMVSSKWLQALASTPTLWAYVEICGSDEDSLATVGLFTHLSREVQLSVTIYLPLGHEAINLHQIMTGVGGRIQRIALAADRRVYELPPLYSLPPELYSAGIKYLLDVLGYASNVTVIHIGDYHGVHGGNAVKVADGFPPLLRVVHGFCFCSKKDLDPRIPFEEIYTCVDLNRLISRLGQMTQLRSLTLIGRGLRSSGTKRKPVKRFEAFSGLLNLTSLSFYGTFHLSWLDLLTAVAPNLVYLQLNIPLSQVFNTSNILRSCVSLRTLLYHLRDWNELDQGGAVPNFIPCTSSLAVMDLEYFGFVSATAIPTDGSFEARLLHLEQLIMAIAAVTTLSRKIEEASFILDLSEAEVLTGRFLDCISHLPGLKRVDLHGTTGWPVTLNERRTTLEKRLELLNNAPRLSAIWSSGITDQVVKNMPEYGNVRTLQIYDSDPVPRWMKFPPNSLPLLINLRLSVSGSQHFQLGSLLALTSITVERGPAVTSLCFAILYQAEDCPCLSEIKFLLDAPEWDVLFNMLERRNFLTNSTISRIRGITLPFVPQAFFAILASLLCGIYAERPSNEDLSLEGIIDLVFDRQIYGCFTCLRNMLGPCEEPHGDFNGRPWNLEALNLSVYSTVENPPPLGVNSAMAEWINRREMHVLRWNSTVEELAPQYWRNLRCAKLASAQVEITEQDVFAEI